MEKYRIPALIVVLALVVGGIVYLERPGAVHSSVPAPPSDLSEEERDLAGAANFAGATGWLNTPEGKPLDVVSLRGHVLLVDFWTYSCINCINSFPYLRAWDAAYRDHGLAIVGVHS